MSALRVEELHKSFGHHQVLDGVDLIVGEGSFTAVLGPSGCGKTTLLRIIAGFEYAGAGTVEIGEVVVDDGKGRPVAPARRRVGYVAQEGGLFPHLSVAANVAFGLRRSRQRRARVAELLDFVGLAGLGGRRPDELSGGQQQRVALARALAPEPRLVLLDEPFASLDASLRVSLRGDVARLLRAAGATVVLVTHDQEEALSLGDRVAVMREGRFVQVGEPTDVYARPVDAEAAAFLGDANLLPGRAVGTTAECALGHLALATPLDSGHDVVVLVRPEQCVLTTGDGRHPDNAVVLASDYHGHDAITQVRLDAHPDPIVARVKGTDVMGPGTRVALTVTGTVHAWPAEKQAESEPEPAARDTRSFEAGAVLPPAGSMSTVGTTQTREGH
jgi:iron(III) transport system ATP-binding protein